MHSTSLSLLFRNGFCPESLMPQVLEMCDRNSENCTRVGMQPWWLQLKNEIHRFKYSSGYMQELFNEFRLLIARHKSAEGDMSANKRCTSRLRTFSVVAELNNLAKTTRLTSDLASLTLETSLSLSSRNATYGHTPFPIADERIIHQKSPGRSTPNCYLNGCALERDMTRRRVPKGPS